LAIMIMGVVLSELGTARAEAQGERGPYARIAVLRPHDGHTVDFEAGYVRHLEWHRQARDSWVWYGWTVTLGERQRSFVYASFGHSAAGLDTPVAPVEDERDNVLNVAPHANFAGNALFEFLPGLSRGTGEPTPLSRLELTTVDLVPGAEQAFEAALRPGPSPIEEETLWYRMLAGGPAPRYVRLRPRATFLAVVEGKNAQALPAAALPLVARMTVEVLTLRPTMSLGIAPARP
jgi:hypothetical protein